MRANGVFRLTGLGIVCLVWELIPQAAVAENRAAVAELQAGAAKVEITPPMGVSLDGSISKNGPATSIHDPLHARALVIDDGAMQIAIVIVDQCMTGRDVFDAAKRRVHEAIGLPTERILMAATHTHAAPRTIHIGRQPIDDDYHDQLGKWIAESVIAAARNLAPAKIGFGSFSEADLIACRRSLCEPGTVGANPFGESGERVRSVSGRSTSVIGPAGPTDPQFSVLSIRDHDDRPICVLGNFSIHYCGGYQRGAVSADYFGYFCRQIETALAQGTSSAVVGIMSNGTSGDTGAFQSTDGKRFAAFEGMQHYGRMLAEQAMESIADVPHRADVTLSMSEQEIDLEIRKPSPARLAWARRVLQSPASDQPHRWTRIYAQEAIHLAEYPARKSIKLQAIRIGDIAIAAAPCEVFAETGLQIKRQSPIARTFTIELANGYAGYLPSRSQHEFGGYETWPARSSLLEVGAEQRIREGLLNLLSEVAR